MSLTLCVRCLNVNPRFFDYLLVTSVYLVILFVIVLSKWHIKCDYPVILGFLYCHYQPFMLMLANSCFIISDNGPVMRQNKLLEQSYILMMDNEILVPANWTRISTLQLGCSRFLQNQNETGIKVLKI